MCLSTLLREHQLIERMHLAIRHLNEITFIYSVSRNRVSRVSRISDTMLLYITAPILFFFIFNVSNQVEITITAPPPI